MGILHAIRTAGGLKGLGLEKAHLGVLVVMAFFEDDETGDCWPSCRTIGAWSGQNKCRVATRRTELERMGYITEIRGKRVETGTAVRKYWAFNNEIFPKVEMQQALATKCKMQHDLHYIELKREEELSKVMGLVTDSPFPGVEEEDGEEEGQLPPSYSPVGTTVAPSVPEASSGEEGLALARGGSIGPG
jgi:hypothetical protein